MSGLQNYGNALNSFGSNVEGMNDFLSTYQQNAIDDFNDKIASIKEQGKALVETGGAIEGQYAAGKAVLASYRAYKAKYGKKKKPDDDEDEGDDEGDENGGGEGGETGGQGGETGGPGDEATGGADESEIPGTGADDADAVADAGDVDPLGGLPVGDAGAGASAELPAGAGGASDGTSSMGIAGTDAEGDTSALGPSSNPLTADQASQFTSAPEEPINDPLGANAPEAPEPPPAAGENSSGVQAAARRCWR